MKRINRTYQREDNVYVVDYTDHVSVIRSTGNNSGCMGFVVAITIILIIAMVAVYTYAPQTFAAMMG